jgi:hypothetical protein
MTNTMPTLNDARDHLIEVVDEQIRKQTNLPELGLATLAALLDELGGLSLPADSPVQAIASQQLDLVEEIQKGTQPLSELGGLLVRLYALRRDLTPYLQAWLSTNQITAGVSISLDSLLVKTITQTRELLSARPDVTAVMDDLSAMKHLRGGPADATAFHDFHVLQIAFKNVWLHMFDANLKYAVEQLYEEIVGSGIQSLIPSPVDAFNDIAQLNEFLQGVRGALTVPPPPAMLAGPIPPPPLPSRPGAANRASTVSRNAIPPPASMGTRTSTSAAPSAVEGPSDRLVRLLNEIGLALNEPYAFDVFAPDSYNFGLMVTYRQKWEPGEYQAGDLAATIPLAPGETRKFTKKRVVKESISRKVVERSTQVRSLQTSDTARAESEIMNRSTTATNFKMTSHGSFNIGIGSFDVTNEFGGNNEVFSSSNKKAFHEATLKAAEEYRLERSMEVDTTSSVETEETTSGEISNPNNEITVTYLFYELQRRFKVNEFLYRVRPVIMVAQDVPEPHEIDEAWLIQYQWIIARVLLDESFRPALNYLTSGFAGDEVAISVIRASWEKQRDLVEKLESLTTREIAIRDALRELMVNQTLQKDKVDSVLSGSMALAGAITQSMAEGDLRFTDVAQGGWSADDIEANRKATETRLGYVEQALADAQDKLKSATSAFEAATKEYSAAMQNRYTRHIAIDQLRIHVKQNILYYMQAIWAHEPSDQRYFRLYQKEILCPNLGSNCDPTFTANPGDPYGYTAVIDFTQTCVPGLGGSSLTSKKHTLVEMADLDNPIGYKGNYIIFPLLGECDLTTYLIMDFVDNHYGVNDPAVKPFDAEDFDNQWQLAAGDPTARAKLRDELLAYIKQARESTDEIIVPTGQLFIEALPGSHPLLEDFKLYHRLQDVLKVKAEVQHAELENLRLAARLVEGQTEKSLLEDPDIEKKVVVEGNVSL